MRIKQGVRLVALMLLPACNLFGFSNLAPSSPSTYSPLPTTLQELTFSGESPAAVPGYEAVSARTQDGQIISVDITLLYVIDPTKSDQIQERWGDTYITNFLVPVFRHTTQNEVSTYTARQLYGPSRKDFQDSLHTTLSKNLAVEGFILKDLLLRDIKFSPYFLGTAESEVVAAQNTAVAQETLAASPATQLELTLSGTPPYALPGYEGVKAKTRDSQIVTFDITLIFTLDPPSLSRIQQKWGDRYVTDFLVPTLRQTTQNMTSLYTARDLYGEGRVDFAQTLQTEINKDISAEGFIFGQLLIRNISFDPVFVATVESEIVAAQKTAFAQPTASATP